jgi:hypothetical protein
MKLEMALPFHRLMRLAPGLHLRYCSTHLVRRQVAEHGIIIQENSRTPVSTAFSRMKRACVPLCAVLLSGAVSSILAVEEDLPGPLTVSVGWSYLGVGTRAVTSPKSVALGVAWQTQDQGLWGTWGVKGLYRLAQSGEGRLDDLGLLYVERIPYDSRVYFGYGAGVWAWRLDDRREVSFGVLRGIGVGAEGLVGYQLDPPTDDLRIAFEASLILVTPMHSFSTSGIALAAVVGF